MKDDLRKNLFSILRGLGVSLEQPDAPNCLEHFLARGFTLLQAVKWPLCDSARTLRPTERRLIEHSVKTHLAAEITAIQPMAIVALGRVACFACGTLFGNRHLSFAEKPKLEDVRGRRFEVTLYDGFSSFIYSTGLPVSRRAGDFSKISNELEPALTAHWDPQACHVKQSSAGL